MPTLMYASSPGIVLNGTVVKEPTPLPVSVVGSMYSSSGSIRTTTQPAPSIYSSSGSSQGSFGAKGSSQTPIYRTQQMQQQLPRENTQQRVRGHTNPSAATGQPVIPQSKAPVLGAAGRSQSRSPPKNARDRRYMSPPPAARSAVSRAASNPSGPVSLSSSPPTQLLHSTISQQAAEKEARQTRAGSNRRAVGDAKLLSAPSYKTMYDLLMAACQLLEQRFTNLDQVRHCVASNKISVKRLLSLLVMFPTRSYLSARRIVLVWYGLATSRDLSRRMGAPTPTL